MGISDYTSLLYAPVYGALAVDVSLQVPDATSPVDIQGIDKTDGVTTETDLGGNGPTMEMIRPAVIFRYADLDALEIDIGEMDGGIVVMNGKTWRIESHRYLPSPGGEADGQVRCILIEGA